MAHPTLRTIRTVALFSALLALTGPSYGPELLAQGSDATILVSRSYTTTARIFPNPTALSSFARNEHTVVDGLTGFSAEVQIPLPISDFSVGLSVEYLSFVEEGVKTISLGGVPRDLPIRDGFILIPIELRGIISIPIQSETVRLTMAGGMGAYMADRILEVADVGVRSESQTIGYGIHISVSFEYMLLPGLWLHGETRFRDADVTLEYAYEKLTTVYQGVTLPFPASPMQTRLNVDGMSLSAGLMVEIPRVFGR